MGTKVKVALGEQIIRYKPSLRDYDLLLISGMTTDLPAVRKVVLNWRRESNNPVILGGPMTSDPTRSLTKTGADIAIIGEGECTLEEVLDNLMEEDRYHGKLAGIKGVAYIDEMEAKLNPLRSVLSRKAYNEYKPSTNVISDYPLFYASRVYIEVLRGCSNYHRARLGVIGSQCNQCNKCTGGELLNRYDCPLGIPPGCGYCSVPSLYGPPKSRYQENIKEEVESLLEKGVHRIVLSAPDFLDYGRDLLVDPSPLTDPREPEPNYVEIEKLLSTLSGLPHIQDGSASLCIENVKASLVTETAAEILGRYLSGTPVNIGFETGSFKHSLELGRPSTPSENLRAIKILEEAGMKPYVYFVHGLPGQTEETAMETMNAITESVKLGSKRVILYRFHSLPMSSLCQEPSGAPAAIDRISWRIKQTALKENSKIKNDILGKRIRVIIAEPYEKNHSYYVTYPMKHGPVVLVKDVEDHKGEIIEVEIAEKKSDRIVIGIL
jgi:radical SAM superfamily enzyme YgiQ (UPF0313 family)